MNTFTICNKELQSYFRSPIAYTVIALWALIGGFFFYFGLSFFVQRSMEGAMTGQSFPMDINEWIVRPLLSNVNVVALFLIPFAVYAVFLWGTRAGVLDSSAWSPARLAWLLIAALVFLVYRRRWHRPWTPINRPGRERCDRRRRRCRCA